MSVDPKFANMPWIAHDEPDVYETDDLPEADQRKSEVLPKEIERTSISADKARHRYEHCKVDAANVDFSDKITGSGKVGYAVESPEYVSNVDGEKESTLIARFQSLQAEVCRLIDDTEAVKKEAGAAARVGELTVEQISTLASSLNAQLNELQLEEIFGSDLDLSDLCVHDALLQKQPKQAPRKDERPGECITFELYSKPSDKIDATTEKTLELDRRLQRLEMLVGSREVTATGAGGLMETAARLSERVSLLQPSYLEQVEARIATLETRLADVTNNPENVVLADADSQNKIAELFEIMKRWNSFSADLPIVIDRLKDLQTLHAQASEFSTTLVNMEIAQKRIDENLATYGSQLRSVQESLSNALSTFKENTVAIGKAMKSP
ncbi:Dynactin subunit 2 [Echinococcus granulosus]|uniref:Dynactin subunit 2 n=1 Tax=Echinococcus granulosus TaxID=6210 RepID=W6UQZ2_ECHGR|nr:Dynactin subunit 2 [Echinococcus granulosus]EUB63633.1 Dynactin subunit 2 [Echinococcus granulosus]